MIVLDCDLNNWFGGFLPKAIVGLDSPGYLVNIPQNMQVETHLAPRISNGFFSSRGQLPFISSWFAHLTPLDP